MRNLAGDVVKVGITKSEPKQNRISNFPCHSVGSGIQVAIFVIISFQFVLSKCSECWNI
jgi:hypothetical protein